MGRWRYFFGGLLITWVIGITGCSEGNRIARVEEENKALVQRIHSEVSKGNQAIFDEVLDSDYVRHCQAMPPGLQ